MSFDLNTYKTKVYMVSTGELPYLLLSDYAELINEIEKQHAMLNKLEDWLKIAKDIKPDYEGTLVDNFPPGYWSGKRSAFSFTLNKIEELRKGINDSNSN